MFNTAIELAGVNTPRFDASQSLVNPAYKYNDPVYLNDLNVAVPLMDAGIKESDKANLKRLLNPQH